MELSILELVSVVAGPLEVKMDIAGISFVNDHLKYGKVPFHVKEF